MFGKERNRSLGRGLVTISCLVVADIRLRRCSQLEESPSLNPNQFPFQLARLCAAELAQILFIGQHKSLTEPAATARQEPPRSLGFILLPRQSRSPDGHGDE